MTREEAIKILNVLAWVQGGPDREKIIKAVSMAIESLSADRPQGEWVQIERSIVKAWSCSRCGNVTSHHTDYCAVCGADMRKDK